MAVTWQNVQTATGRTLTSTEQAQATMWIQDARTIISNRAVREQTTLDQLDQPTLDLVVREAVTARIKRPDGAKQVSISVDDGQVSRTYETATGQIEITDTWWDLLFPDAEPEAWSAQPSCTPDCHSPLYRPSTSPVHGPGWECGRDW